MLQYFLMPERKVDFFGAGIRRRFLKVLEKISLCNSAPVHIKDNFGFTLKGRAKFLVPHAFGYFTGKDVVARIVRDCDTLCGFCS